MAKSVTFVPRTYASADPGDLTYVERVSRNRSIHALLQETAPNRPASRRNFLLKAYREIVARYLAVGRVEHPLPLLRHLIWTFDGFSRRVDCRVDDFRGLGLYVLIQDGNTFFLLAGRDGRVALRRGTRFQRLESGVVDGVRELPVDSSAKQKELFSTTLRDFLALYRIDTDEKTGPLSILMGGAGEEIGAVIDVLQEPGSADRLPREGTVNAAMVSHAVMYGSFSLAEPVRAPVLPPVERARPGWARRAAVAATALAIAGVGATAVWLTDRYVDERPATAAVETQPRSASGAQESPARLRDDTTQEQTLEGAPAAVASEENEVQLSLEWSKSLKRAVTTTPALEGDDVIFGARDGNLYAFDRATGGDRWRVAAADGIGSSPVIAGGSVLAADYSGNVFSVDRKTGNRQWTRKLTAKVVSTPAVGGGELVVACVDGIAYGLSLETGRVLWKVETSDRIRGSIAYADGRFFIPSYDGHVYAVAGGSGSVLWRHSLGGPVSSSPAVAGDVVVVGSENRRIHAIDVETGAERWERGTVGPVRSFVGVYGGDVYAGCSDNIVYCVDAASGEEKWRHRTGGSVLSRPFVVEGIVFVTSYDGYIYCLDASTGELVDRYETGGEVFSSPVADDVRVYFGNNAGRFYCVRYRGDPAS